MIRRSYRILGPFAFVILSCARGGEPERKDQASRDSATATAVRATETAAATNQPEARTEAQLPPPSLTCSPTNFGPADTLTLRMNVPHGDYLIATQPADSLFYIIYPQRNVPSRKYSLIPPEGFKHMETLRLSPDVKSVPWYYGRDTTLAPLFPRPGKYVLTMGENLEGDNARGASCTVFFGEKERR